MCEGGVGWDDAEEEGHGVGVLRVELDGGGVVAESAMGGVVGVVGDGGDEGGGANGVFGAEIGAAEPVGEGSCGFEGLVEDHVGFGGVASCGLTSPVSCAGDVQEAERL